MISWCTQDVQQHLKDLKAVFYELEAGGLTLSLKKCNLCKKEIIVLLGHAISEEEIKTEETKVEAVKNFPTPMNFKEVQRFLGLAGW